MEMHTEGVRSQDQALALQGRLRHAWIHLPSQLNSAFSAADPAAAYASASSVCPSHRACLRWPRSSSHQYSALDNQTQHEASPSEKSIEPTHKQHADGCVLTPGAVHTWTSDHSIVSHDDILTIHRRGVPECGVINRPVITPQSVNRKTSPSQATTDCV